MGSLKTKSSNRFSPSSSKVMIISVFFPPRQVELIKNSTWSLTGGLRKIVTDFIYTNHNSFYDSNIGLFYQLTDFL